MKLECYVEFDSTGKIIRIDKAPPGVYFQVPYHNVTKTTVGDISPGTHWVSGGQVVYRPRMGVGIFPGRLKGVPSGALVTIQDVTYEADGTEIELSFGSPGTYPIRISLWPFQDVEVVYEDSP